MRLKKTNKPGPNMTTPDAAWKSTARHTAARPVGHILSNSLSLPFTACSFWLPRALKPRLDFAPLNFM